MGGRKSRSKGKRGEREARNLLADRDWVILANTADGDECEDIIATCPKGTVYSIEVKNARLIHVVNFKKQAVTNANKKKLPWMILAKIETTSSWLVMRKSCKPVVWHEKR